MDGRTAAETGIYTVTEASRLTDVPPARIRRWLRGYEFGERMQRVDKSRAEQGKQPPTPDDSPKLGRFTNRGKSPPIWRGQLPPLDRSVELGFLDLMEVRFVDAFLKAGLSLQTIRRAERLAADLVGQDHPFSTQKFSTDGKVIFAELVHKKGDKSVLDLERRQFGLYEVIAPSLLKGVEFDEQGQAMRWRPFVAELPLIVIDPLRQFGQPIVDEGGVQTSALAEAVRAEGGDLETVARWFDISPAAVRQAVEFEFRLRA